VNRSRARQALRHLARVDLRPSARASDRARVDDMGADLIRAISRSELTLHFQPISDLRTGQCRRVEALVRWTHPRTGVVDPRDIIRLAEQTDSLDLLARWVVQASAERRTQWSRDGLELGVAVNLAGPELHGEGPLGLLGAIAAGRAQASAFTFEVPASVLAQADARIRDGLRALSTAGARISVDHVSLADMPPRSMSADLDELKISRALVLRAVADESAAAQLRSLVERARDLGLATVAVGVEDGATYRLVSAYGYDLAQGFWMSRPLAAHDVSRWRGWVARIALGGAAALVAPFGFARVALGTGGAPSQTSVDPQRGSQCCARPSTGQIVDTGIAMTELQPNGARLLVEAAIGGADAARIRAAVAGDVAEVERMLATSFERQPAVYVFATRASFAFALQRSFGQSGTDAGMLAAANGGVAFPRQGAIVINWESARADASLSVVRHELTHLLVHEIAGVESELPAWFDEGLASLAAREVPSTDVLLAPNELMPARDASATLALLAQGTASLSALSSPADWSIRNAQLDGRGYAVAAEAVGMLRASGGFDGLRTLLERSRAVGFGQAFGEMRGESVADFAAAFPARFASTHAELRLQQAPRGSSVEWSVSGVRPHSAIAVTIDGADYHLEFEAQSDRDGVYSAVFGGTVRAGEYSITIVARGMRASTILAVR
jgi:EAL domain-containing protein (putative c-di-GMP-specific phosphodiesterase class I)